MMMLNIAEVCGTVRVWERMIIIMIIIIIIMIIIAMMKKLNIAEAGGSGCGGAEAGPAMRSRTAHPAMQAKNFMGCHQDLEFGVAKDEDKCSSGLSFQYFQVAPFIMRSQRVVLGTY